MTEPGSERWFAVRCVFRIGGRDSTLYEERLTLWRATDLDDAIALAEAEAEAYAEPIAAEFLGLAQGYELIEAPGNGAEVFSLMRDSVLAPHDYLAAFFSTGAEHTQEWEQPAGD
jgi:hypothetical protein